MALRADEFARLSAKYTELFAGVPAPLRREVIAVVNGEPYSWESAYLEIKNATATGKALIEQLKTIGLFPK